MKKKGQAALEFLITYGWAIVIIVGIIASLFFMGVQNPDRYISSRCLFEDSFVCADFGFEPNNNRVVLELENIIGAPIELIEIDTVVDGDSLCDFSRSRVGSDFSAITSNVGGFAVAAGETFFLNLTCSPAQSLEDELSVALDVDIEYQIQREGYFPKTASGRVVGRT
ncbi:MAG: hypothetical protein ACOCUT_04145 [bacterium]